MSALHDQMASAAQLSAAANAASRVGASSAAGASSALASSTARLVGLNTGALRGAASAMKSAIPALSTLGSRAGVLGPIVSTVGIGMVTQAVNGVANWVGKQTDARSLIAAAAEGAADAVDRIRQAASADMRRIALKTAGAVAIGVPLVMWGPGPVKAVALIALAKIVTAGVKSFLAVAKNRDAAVRSALIALQSYTERAKNKATPAKTPSCGSSGTSGTRSVGTAGASTSVRGAGGVSSGTRSSYGGGYSSAGGGGGYRNYGSGAGAVTGARGSYGSTSGLNTMRPNWGSPTPYYTGINQPGYPPSYPGPLGPTSPQWQASSTQPVNIAQYNGLIENLSKFEEEIRRDAQEYAKRWDASDAKTDHTTESTPGASSRTDVECHTKESKGTKQGPHCVLGDPDATRTDGYDGKQKKVGESTKYDAFTTDNEHPASTRETPTQIVTSKETKAYDPLAQTTGKDTTLTTTMPTNSAGASQYTMDQPHVGQQQKHDSDVPQHVRDAVQKATQGLSGMGTGSAGHASEAGTCTGQMSDWQQKYGSSDIPSHVRDALAAHNAGQGVEMDQPQQPVPMNTAGHSQAETGGIGVSGIGAGVIGAGVGVVAGAAVGAALTNHLSNTSATRNDSAATDLVDNDDDGWIELDLTDTGQESGMGAPQTTTDAGSRQITTDAGSRQTTTGTHFDQTVTGTDSYQACGTGTVSQRTQEQPTPAETAEQIKQHLQTDAEKHAAAMQSIAEKNAAEASGTHDHSVLFPGSYTEVAAPTPEYIPKTQTSSAQAAAAAISASGSGGSTGFGGVGGGSFGGAGSVMPGGTAGGVMPGGTAGGVMPGGTAGGGIGGGFGGVGSGGMSGSLSTPGTSDTSQYKVLSEQDIKDKFGTVEEPEEKKEVPLTGLKSAGLPEAHGIELSEDLYLPQEAIKPAATGAHAAYAGYPGSAGTTGNPVSAATQSAGVEAPFAPAAGAGAHRNSQGESSTGRHTMNLTSASSDLPQTEVTWGHPLAAMSTKSGEAITLASATTSTHSHSAHHSIELEEAGSWAGTLRGKARIS